MHSFFLCIFTPMKRRFFAELAYNGSAYVGWQKQPGQSSVQGTIENALSTILNQPIEVLGCGRTDTGVHAKYFVLHFDYDGSFPHGFIRRLNKFLPPDICIYRISPVADQAHARFDATRRAYRYYITKEKDPFRQHTAYHFPFYDDLNPDLLQESAQLIRQYDHFFPFCKTNSDAKTMRCRIDACSWSTLPSQKELVFYISADRFLRGMVRLIVGMSLELAIGKTSLESVRKALDQQSRLERSWSVPPDGLFLTEVHYEYLDPCQDF